MKIGLLVISTGAEYHKFVEPLLSSVERHFLNGHDVAVHLWTDSTGKFPGTQLFPVEALKWPFPTLYRYHYFTQQAAVLAANDYLFYLDVDMLVVGPVGDEILADGITSVQHPGYTFNDDRRLPYDDNPSSAAYVEMQRYFAGGFQGGKTAAYLRMAGTIRDAIDADLKRDYIARWHDESHYNKYLSLSPPARILDPSYCYPEDASSTGNAEGRAHYLARWPRDYEPRIIALTKSRESLAASR